jgi:methylated-DNA-[protein]-cysteine S-methyltransferase
MKTIAFDKVTTTEGAVYIAVRSGKIVAIQFGGSAVSLARDVCRRAGAEPVWDAAAVRGAARQVKEYFAGKRRVFRLVPDWSVVTPFQAKVLRAALRIPYGKVRTYGDIAIAIGMPGAARAVGQALGANPFAPVVPCHRVVARDGSLGGYSAVGGVAVKRRLLRMESSARE